MVATLGYGLAVHVKGVWADVDFVGPLYNTVTDEYPFKIGSVLEGLIHRVLQKRRYIKNSDLAIAKLHFDLKSIERLCAFRSWVHGVTSRARF